MSNYANVNDWAAKWRKMYGMDAQGVLNQNLDQTRVNATRAGIGNSPGYLQSLQNPAYGDYYKAMNQAEAQIGQGEMNYDLQQQQIDLANKQFEASQNPTFMDYLTAIGGMAGGLGMMGAGGWISKLLGLGGAAVGAGKVTN
jgi:hypothetical protein